MAAITQIRHRHSEGRATKIIHAVPPAPEAAVLRLLSLSSSSAQPAGHRGRQDRREPAESSIASQRTAHEHATLRNRRPSKRSARTERLRAHLGALEDAPARAPNSQIWAGRWQARIWGGGPCRPLWLWLTRGPPRGIAGYSPTCTAIRPGY